MATAGSIVIDLLLKTGSFSTDAGRAEREMKKLERQIDKLAKTTALYAVGAASAFALAVKSSANYMEQMGQAAERTSVSTKSFSELAYAAKDVALSQGELERILRRSTEAINHAGEGTSKQAKALKALGISAHDSSGHIKSADEMLKTLAERFSKLEPGARKTGLVIDLFGQQLGQKVIPLLNKGADGLEGLAAEARRFGVAIDDEAAQAANEFNTNLSKLADAARGVGITIASELLPGINEYVSKQGDASIATEMLASSARFLGDHFKELVAVSSGVGVVLAASWALTGAKNIAVYTAALMVNTGATVRAVGAARLLAGIIGMMATPIGLVSIALGAGVTAWQLWGREANTARGTVDALTRDIADLKDEFLSLNDTKRRGMLIDFEEDLRGLTREVDKSILKLREMSESAPYWATLPDEMRPVYENLRDNILAISDSNVDASEKAELLKNTILNLGGSVPENVYQDFLKIALAASSSAGEVMELAQVIATLQGQIDAPVVLRTNRVTPPRVVPTPKSRPKKEDEGERLIKQMNERIALLGKETEYEQLAAKIGIDAIKFRSGAQKEMALELAKTLDMRVQEIEHERTLKELREQQSITQTQFMRDLEAFGQGNSVRQLNSELERVEDRYRAIIDARRNSPLGLSEDELAQIKESLDIELEMVQQHHEDMKALRGDWTLGASEALNNYVDNARDVAGQVEDIFANAFSGIEDTVFDFVKTGQMDLRGLLGSITDDVLRMLIRMGVQMTANAILGKTLGATSTAASIAMGTATATAWAPAAAFASLASFGGNSMPAMAGISSTVGLAQGLALTGMAHDGIDAVPKTGTWLLEKGERVMTSDTSARLDAVLNRIENRDIAPPVLGNAKQRSSGVTVNLIESRERAGEVESRKNDSGEEEANVFVADIHGRGSRAQILEETYGLRRMGK